jgi:hypothetical protein
MNELSPVHGGMEGTGQGHPVIGKSGNQTPANEAFPPRQTKTASALDPGDRVMGTREEEFTPKVTTSATLEDKDYPAASADEFGDDPCPHAHPTS